MLSLCIKLMQCFILMLQLPVNGWITALAKEIAPSSISVSVKKDFMELTAHLVNIDSNQLSKVCPLSASTTLNTRAVLQKRQDNSPFLSQITNVKASLKLLWPFLIVNLKIPGLIRRETAYFVQTTNYEGVAMPDARILFESRTTGVRGTLTWHLGGWTERASLKNNLVRLKINRTDCACMYALLTGTDQQ